MAAPSQQVCISSFGDKMVFGEVSPYSTHDVMRNFLRRLVSLGVEVELASNDHDALPETKREKHGARNAEKEAAKDTAGDDKPEKRGKKRKR